MSKFLEQCPHVKVSLRNKLPRLFDSDGVAGPLAKLAGKYDLAD
jgi:hypothetical protein